MGLSLYPTKGKPLIEYDFTKPTPIDFKDIEEGMLIMHKDEDKFFIGIANWESRGIWYERGGGYVADSAFQNYVFPKKPKPLPTENGARIRTLSDHSAVPKGSTLTFNLHASLWFVDGYVDRVKPDDLQGVEWEAIKVVPVDA